jgi:hypothetical protein
VESTSVAQPVTKRADQLVVGDRILPHRLPAVASKPGEVLFVQVHEYRTARWVFVAYRLPDGFYDSTAYLPDGTVEVYLESPADDGEVTQPIAGRAPAEVAGGLVQVDPPEGFVPASTPPDMTGAAVTQSCVFGGDIGGWCCTHQAVHIASGEGECGCPVYPYMGRGDLADTIIDHRRECPAHPYAVGS